MGTTDKSVQMNMSGFLSPDSLERVDWMAPLQAQSEAPRAKSRSKGRRGGSVTKAVACNAEQDAEGEQDGTGEGIAWPDAVADDVRERVEEFVAPTGYEIVPRPKSASSLVWYTGVRVKHTQTKDIGWICLASLACAQKMEVCSWSGSTSNWSRHLETHQIRSKRSSKMEATRKETSERFDKAQSTNWFKMGKHRCSARFPFPGTLDVCFGL